MNTGRMNTANRTRNSVHGDDTPVLEIEDLSVDYRSRSGDPVPALHRISLRVPAGQTAAVVGESGSGKSTTASAALGLLAGNAELSGGSIRLHTDSGTHELTQLSPRAFKRLRGKEIGYVPQDPGNSLNPVKTILSNVEESLRIHTDLDRTARRQRVVDLLEMVGIDRPELRAGQFPHELSGGMRQRVLIASAIALRPRLLIADEPTSALDVTVQKRILDLLDRLQADTGMGILFITHDLSVAAERAQTLTVVQHGRVRESGPAAGIIARPKSEYTRRLLADVPRLELAALSATEVPAGAAADTAGATAATGDGAGTTDPAAEPVVEVHGITKVYARTDAGVIGSEDVSFTIPRGKTLGVVGESGSGKSTVGKMLSGYLKPDSGRIRVADMPVTELPPERDTEYRRRVQLVFQNPATALDPKHTIGASLAEPLRNFRIGTRSDRAERIAEALRMVALDPQLADRRPRELSGGQLQRVAIARALIVDPDVVVFDEAVSALDVTVQAQILELITELQERMGLTYLFITHDLAVIAQVAHEVLVLSHAHEVESGPTARVLARPRDEYTRMLLDAVPRGLD